MHRGWRRASQGYLHRLSPEDLAKGKALREGRQERTEKGVFTEVWLRRAARNWRLLVGRAIEDGPTLLGPNYTEVRYEDLLDHPHAEVGRLLGFLGVDTDETLVEHCVGSASFQKLSKGRRRGQEDPSSFYRKG